jgi:hypothetical protein
MNLSTLNDDMKKFVNGKWTDLKHFVELPNEDKDVIVDKTLIEKANNLPIVEELNCIGEPEFDREKRSDFTNIDT